jgi:phospholipase C
MQLHEVLKDRIDTIFIVIMENRSFDHMLGYLSLAPFNRDVEGISQAWKKSYSNTWDGITQNPWHRSDPSVEIDPPHERTDISVQMGDPIANAPMTGFMESYASDSRVTPAEYADVMGYYTPAEVPVTDFLAQNYLVCDRWFAAVPSSTQPNRLMAMAGYSMRDATRSDIVEDHRLVYDWLEDAGKRWRVYYESFPFFMLMTRVAERFLGDVVDRGKFRHLSRLKNDMLAPDPMPDVVFIEPAYYDAPHVAPPDDNHPLAPITGGEQFLWRVYDAVTSNFERWQRSLMTVTYDENGGFFDHVSPPACTSFFNHGESYVSYATLGVRVPAMVVSPWTQRPKNPSGYVGEHHGILDHLSVLKLLAQKFTPGQDYSSDTAQRTVAGSVGDISVLASPDQQILAAPPYPTLMAVPAAADELGMLSPNALAFRQALEYMRGRNASAAAQLLPALSHYFR